MKPYPQDVYEAQLRLNRANDKRNSVFMKQTDSEHWTLVVNNIQAAIDGQLIARVQELWMFIPPEFET